MKTLKHLISVVIFICIVGCTNQENILSDNIIDVEEDIIILQERNKNYPLTDYKSLKAKSIETRSGGDLALSDFIGRSYKLENYPFENARNLGFPVIDMAKYIADNPTSYQSVPVKESESLYNSFSGIERYETKIQKTNTVSTGFQLDFKIFKIGAKKTYKNVFKATDTEIGQNVFGELSVKYYDRKYELLIPMNIRKDIYRNYMHSSFVDQLYYSSTDELIKFYGGFILTKFLSGGQANALFSGQYLENSHDEDNQREDNLNSEINASINTGNGGSSTRNTVLSYQNDLIGRQPGSSMSYTNKFQNIKFSLRTLGGLPAYTQFTVPKDINSHVFDISAWSQSLGNSSNLTIAELIDESLIPISDFIEEDNLKKALYKFYEKGPNSHITYLGEPHIKLRMVYYNQQIAVWETDLVNRYGDHIVLRRAMMFPLKAKEYLQQESARVSQLFPHLSIVGIPDYYKTNNYGEVTLYDDINEFDMSNMSKYMDPLTGKIYLLTIVPLTGEKRAYTLYDENVINDYVFRDLINNLPFNNNVDLNIIRNQYYIVAL